MKMSRNKAVLEQGNYTTFQHGSIGTNEDEEK
jgi:hypothetical protein